MTAATYLSQLSPELCLLAGACLVWLFGVSKSSGVRSLMAPFTLLILVAAMIFTAQFVRPTTAEQPAGLLFTELTHYVRWSTLVVGTLLLLVNWRTPAEREQGEFFGMILCSMTGVMLTASANDLVVLFLALELVSVPTYVLVALSRTNARASEAALKYFFLGAMAAAIMVYGFSFLYGVSGTTVLAGAGGNTLQDYFTANPDINNYAMIGLLLAFAGLAFKVAAVPFHAYVSDVYEGAASPVTAFLGFVPKLAGFVAMAKIMSACNWHFPEPLLWMLWIIAALTMTVGNVLALLQHNVKRILAYSGVAHSGYMLLGILVGPAWGDGPMHDGVAAVLFYIVVYGIMNLGAFAVLATLNIKGKPVETLDDLAGISRTAPAAALAMVICTFSLMGFPPTAGFMGKVYLFSGAFSTGEQWLVTLAVIAVINSAIGAAYYLRIASACYLRDPTTDHQPTGGFAPRIALAIATVAMIVLFVRPTDLVTQAQRATQSIQTQSSSLAQSPIIDRTLAAATRIH